MPKKLRLRVLHDVYRFPGFVPNAQVRGVFGDPMAVVISFIRRGNKLHAARVGDGIAALTTRDYVVSATCRAVTSGRTWNWRYDEWSAGVAAR